MPRGVPKNGFRKPRSDRGVARKGVARSMRETFETMPLVHVKPETEAETAAKILERFEITKEITEAACAGDVRSAIISGPAGLGKSYTVEQTLAKWDPSGFNHTVIKGYVKATGLYKALYQFREAGQIIVFDDADSIFFDDTSLNFLKAVCDTNDVRRVSYRAESNMIDEESGDKLPRDFEFNGTIIFITNLDFDAMIDRGHKLAPHLQAMVSRSHYIDLAMKTKQDYIVRIKQVVGEGLLKNKGLTETQQKEVVDFVITNQDRMRELSLRMVLKVATIRKMNSQRWENYARVTCCKQ